VADPTQKWHMVDITIALTQLALRAVELGYGTCWIGAFDEAGVKQVLNIGRHFFTFIPAIFVPGFCPLASRYPSR